MRVADVMSRATVTDSPADSLRSAASLMWGHQTGSLLVMSGDDLRGIVTERDVMKAVARGLDPETTPVSAVMTTALITVTPDTDLPTAARLMADRWIRHLPVVVENQVLGVVSQRDLVGVLLQTADTTTEQGRLPRDQRLSRIEDQRRTAIRPAATPDQTGDDTDLGWGERAPSDNDERLSAERPPHHDR